MSGRFARKFSVPPRLARAGKTAATCIGITALLLVLGSRSLQTAIAEGDTRTLSFHHVHTGEDITVTFKRNGRYDQAALKKLNWFMRDWRKNEETTMEPQLFDALWETYRDVGATEPIQVICGYRSPGTNAMLRARSSGVAQFSLHTKGDAIDFFIPGVPLEKIRYAGLRLQRGGVGFYPTSGSPFIHMDVGSIRHWPRMTHDQLVKVFPDGRTVHIPTDGQPLARYALALADVEKKGHAPSAVSLASARNAGAISEADEDDAERVSAPPKRNADPQLIQVARADPGFRSPGIQPPLQDASTAPSVKVATVSIIPMPKQRPAKQIAVASLVPTPLSRPASAPTQIAVADPVVTATTGQAAAYADEAVTPEVSRPAPMGVIASADAQAPLPKSDQLAFLHPATRIDNPWMRATVMAPNVRQFLTATPTGRLDTRQVREFMEKPRTPVVMMGFSADPQNGLRTDMFSGQAVVFLATLPSTMRTASLSR
ncbi:MAG TPA: DUF882 domain-containing protein [Pseudolabrys sp.]|nr:DUF882 domain-containing protein [Pseudolabrys sp.]